MNLTIPVIPITRPLPPTFCVLPLVLVTFLPFMAALAPVPLLMARSIGGMVCPRMLKSCLIQALIRDDPSYDCSLRQYNYAHS
jgi:hypothetical protein